MGYEIPKEFRPAPVPGSVPESALTLEWSGTAGFRLVYKNCTLLIDPFVSRTGIWKTAFGKLKVDESLASESFPIADHILLGHSHYDHILDVPYIAKKTGAVVHGSASTANVCKGAAVPEKQIDVVKPGKAFECGAFKVKFIESLHGKALFGRTPCPGEINDVLVPPQKMNAYRIGGVYGLLIEAGGFKIFHSGSADLIDARTKSAGNVDLLLLGLAGRKKTPDYLKRMTALLNPKYIVPQHYDNFFKPMSKGLTLLYSINIGGFLEEAKTVCPDVRIVMPGLFEKIAFDTATHKLL